MSEQAIQEILERLGRIEDAVCKRRKPQKTKAERDRPAPNERITNGLRGLTGILNKKGKSSMTITVEMADWFWERGKAIGWKKFKQQSDIIIRWFAWYHRYDPNKHGPHNWKTGIMTVFNNWDDQVAKGEAFLEKHGDAPGVRKPKPQLKPIPEPKTDWRGYIEKNYGADNRPWYELPRYLQEEIIKNAR